MLIYQTGTYVDLVIQCTVREDSLSDLGDELCDRSIFFEFLIRIDG